MNRKNKKMKNKSAPYSFNDDDDIQEQVMGLGNLSSDDDDSTDSDEDKIEDLKYDVSDNSSDDELFQVKGAPANYETDEEDERMMGKRRHDYFGTDITDSLIHKKNQKWNRLKGTDSSDLVLEESIKLREKLAAKIKPSSILNMIDEDDLPRSKSKKNETFSDDSSKKKKNFQYPEFDQTLSDYNELNEDLEKRLSPLFEAKKQGLLPKSPCVDYLETRYFLVRNFIVAISCYMMIRYSEHYHPKHESISRVVQYRHLLKELDNSESKFAHQLETLLNKLKNGKLEPPKQKVEKPKKPIKMLGILKKNKKIRLKNDSDEEEEDWDSPVNEKKKNKEKKRIFEPATDSEEEISEMEDDEVPPNEDNLENRNKVEENGTRHITYQIAKNKGLLPSRNKAQRNPRIKYKLKYKDKLNRRKGMHRGLKKELKRYAGEASGIKTHLVKSVKFK